MIEPLKIKKSDQFPSDEWILNMFDKWFDPCPLNENPTFDGLSVEWGKRTYVNPPYSNPLPWVEKAIEESKKGKTIVMLLKMDTSTKWFAKLQEAGANFMWINKRLKYGAASPVPFPSMLVYLRSNVVEKGEGSSYGAVAHNGKVYNTIPYSQNLMLVTFVSLQECYDGFYKALENSNNKDELSAWFESIIEYIPNKNEIIKGDE